MNDFSELESDLKKLRPRNVAPNLMARVEQALALPEAQTPSAGVTRAPRKLHWNWWPLGLGLAAAAGFLLLARMNFDQPTAKPQTFAAATPSTQTSPTTARANSLASDGTFVPSGLTQVVYRTQDEGLHFAQGADRPVRRVRSKKRETLQWENSATGASLRVSYPTEEVTLIPISGQ
ncbi:MAG: hypothetical protein M3Z64_06365 [Verrucomicrobiota bacterium]|nr:hypothetical protein [Verrucomicrobiota bacterium]